MQPRSCQEGERSRESACLQYAFTPLAGARRRQRRTRSMVHGKNRIPYRIDRRLTGLAGPYYDATISFGLPIEPEDSQYGKYRLSCPRCRFLDGCSREWWIVSAGYRRRQAEGGYNHDFAKRESAPGSRLVFNAVSPHWRGTEDDKDGQEAWFTARIASLIG